MSRGRRSGCRRKPSYRPNRYDPNRPAWPAVHRPISALHFLSLGTDRPPVVLRAGPPKPRRVFMAFLGALLGGQRKREAKAA